MFKREEIEVVVVGSETNGYWRIFGANYGTTPQSTTGADLHALLADSPSPPLSPPLLTD